MKQTRPVGLVEHGGGGIFHSSRCDGYLPMFCKHPIENLTPEPQGSHGRWKINEVI